jgi:outer membrane immunogenic protein
MCEGYGHFSGDFVMTVTRSVISRSAAALAILVAMLMGPAANADSGFYIGGSIGNAAMTVADIDVGVEFDDNDSAWKGFAGYIVDMPVVDFGIEAGYVDFGAPSDTVLGEEVELDVTGLSAFGLIGVDWGFFGMFAKAGVVSWDAEFAVNDVSLESEDGSDSAYGVGFRFTFSSVEVRLEYEVFDVEDADVDMASLGVLWRF